MLASHAIQLTGGLPNSCARRRPSVKCRNTSSATTTPSMVHTSLRLPQGHTLTVITTPLEAPKANGICERFIGSVRRECLDHVFICGERHLYRIMHTYVDYFNTMRPHQGLAQRIPIPPSVAIMATPGKRLIVRSILGGLHHAYEWAA